MTDRYVRDGLNPAHVSYVDVGGIRTRYVSYGTGEPLVLLHGGEFGSLYSLDAWSLNLPVLGEDFRVYALDRLGQGHTDNPPDDQLDVASLLTHTVGFFEELGIRKAVVVGHSRGGLIATWLAIHHPHLVRRLILVDSQSTAPPDPRYPGDVFYERLGHRQRLLEDDLITPELVRIEPDAQALQPEQVTADFVDRMVRIARLPKTRHAQRQLRANRESAWVPAMNELRSSVLAGIDGGAVRVPVLIIWGLDDRSAPLPLGLSLFERFAATTPAAELHVINGAGHYCFRDQPDAFERAIQSFGR